jgi:hypothetical protein
MTILKSLNGEIVEMTAEEEATFLQQQQEAQIAIAERETAKQAKETAQASGNQKLLDLGLTQAEATALTGYTPPAEV